MSAAATGISMRTCRLRVYVAARSQGFPITRSSELDIGHGENTLDIEQRVQLDRRLLRSDSKAQRHVLQKLRHDEGSSFGCDGCRIQFGALEQ